MPDCLIAKLVYFFATVVITLYTNNFIFSSPPSAHENRTKKTTKEREKFLSVWSEVNMCRKRNKKRIRDHLTAFYKSIAGENKQTAIFCSALTSRLDSKHHSNCVPHIRLTLILSRRASQMENFMSSLHLFSCCFVILRFCSIHDFEFFPSQFPNYFSALSFFLFHIARTAAKKQFYSAPRIS